ncbi:MAG TPA: GFA family protein [Stellaceae bacterium]|nr:GFA family protein [Stellaceae bacterium]
MKLPLTGGCQCGALRYEISEAPLATYTCHCTDCQRLTSSAFSMAITVRDSAFRLTAGEPRFVQKTVESGRVLTRWLCPDCAAWISSSPLPAAAPTETVRRVRAGTLDDTSWLRPTAHFWTRSKQPWVVLPQGGEVFVTQPDLDQFFKSNETR